MKKRSWLSDSEQTLQTQAISGGSSYLMDAQACETADALTLGFSNRTWPALLEILKAYSVACLVDVRSLPGSRKFPQFNLENLEAELPKVGVEYIHLKSLGGFRKARDPDTMNMAWRNLSFRNFADYMQTSEFEEGLLQLISEFKRTRTVYVCTEAVFWRCHRALISDALLARGFIVGHIFTDKKCELHTLTPFARVVEGRVTYPS